MTRVHLACVVAVSVAAWAAVAEAQSSGDTTRTTPSCTLAPDVYRAQMRDLSRHAGWGMAVGAALGVAYGIVDGRPPVRGLTIIAYGLIGGTGGLAVGGGVYGVRRAGGRNARPPCNEAPPDEGLMLPAPSVDAAGPLRSPPSGLNMKRRAAIIERR